MIHTPLRQPHRRRHENVARLLQGVTMPASNSEARKRRENLPEERPEEARVRGTGTGTGTGT